jgi:hypothetical protein
MPSLSYPPELLFEIISYLDTRNLKKCRLVNRQWTEICDEYFLSAVYLSKPTHLTQLLAIAQHARIAGHVRSITVTEGIFAREQEKHCIENEQNDIRLLSDLAGNANLGDNDTRPLLHSLKRLKKLTVSDECSFDTIEWEWMRPDTAQLAVRAHAVTRLFGVVQALLLRAPIHLDELRAEWLDTKFFLSKAAQIGQTWKSLTILGLGIVHDEESRGIQDLKLVLDELTNLRQLHLSSVGPCFTHLDSLVNNRIIAWNGLTDLTLRRFQVGELTLQRLLNIPSMERISLHNIALKGDGCWIRVMTKLQKEKLERVRLSGWLANNMTNQGWGDSNGDENLLEEVANWLMTDAENNGECPFTTENIESM